MTDSPGDAPQSQPRRHATPRDVSDMPSSASMSPRDVNDDLPHNARNAPSGAHNAQHAGDFSAVANRLLKLAMTQRCAQDIAQETLAEALRATEGNRAFLARIEQETGELIVMETAGAGWTEENRELRLQLHNATQRGITGYVAITGQPYLSPDVRDDPHYIAHFPDVRSEIAVPFFDAEGRVRGVLNVESEHVAAFGGEHATRLQTLADVIATSIIFEEYRSRERMLVEIGLDLAATTEIEPLARRVIEVAAQVLKCEGCSVFLLEETTQMLTLHASRGRLNAHAGEASYRLGEGLTGTVALTGESIRLQNPRDDPRWIGRYTEFTPDNLGAFLAVPIIGRNRILGVLRVSRPHSAPAWFQARFTESDERVLRTIASQMGSAIENVRAFNRLVRTERMAAWGELSAKSAHMIGNRTFAIKGDLNELKHLLSQCDKREVLASRDLRQEVAALAASIERGIFRLEEILREFRDFVMATQLDRQEIDINCVVQEVVSETFPKRTLIRLEQEYTPNLPLLRCDADKLKRAFSELIENAVSFMPGGGVLRIATDLIEPGQGPAAARLAPTRRYAQIEFADRGPGIAEEIKEKIFTPFFSSRVKGMGLGLSIVKGIVDAHHGVIREVGEPGQGARFLIYLPANGEKATEK